MPRNVSRFLLYLGAFIVTFGAGAARFLGGEDSRFHVILDAFPKDLQDVIPWAALLMSATAVGVDYFSRESRRPRFLKPAFVLGTALTVVALIITSYALYAAYVVRIEVPAAHTRVAYLVGSAPLPTCECAKRGLEIRECIGNAISLNPDEVAACFPRGEMAMRKTVLNTVYMLTMLAFGVLTGLLVVRVSLRGKKR